MSKGETSKEEKGEELDDNDSSDEKVKIPKKKKPLLTLRKSIRLASKGNRLVVSLDDDSSIHTSHEPKHTTPPSPKPDKDELDTVEVQTEYVDEDELIV